MFTFNICLAVLLSVALLLSEKKLQIKADECSSNLGCSGYNNYCCKQRYSWQSSVCRSGGCVGQSCSSNGDCGGLFEKCCSSTNLCATSSCPECSSSFDCGFNEYCCKQRYSFQKHVCGSGGCVGQPCSSNSDCGGIGECCLNKVCKDSGCYKTTASPYECSSNLDCGLNEYCCKQRYSFQKHVCGSGGCVGQSCSSDSDCGGTGECCLNNVCTKSGCTDCSSNSGCSGFNEYCCKRYSWQDNICRDGGCVDQSCSSNSDCGGTGECCLNNVCKDSGCYDDVAKALNNPGQFQSSPYPPPPAYPNQGQNVPPAQFQTQVPPPAYKY